MIRTMPRTCLFKARAFQGRIDRLHFISGNRAGGFGNRARVVAVFPLQAATANFCLLPRKKTFFARRGILKFYRLWTGILSINAYCLGKFL